MSETARDHVPTLDIYRPIVNVDEGLISQIAGRAAALLKQREIKVRRGVTVNLNTGPYETRVLIGGAIIRFHRINGLPLTEEGLTELGEHLEETLPSSVDKTLWVPTLPVKPYVMSAHKQWVNLGVGQALLDEVDTVKAAISSLYPEATAPDSWEEYPETASLKVVAVSEPNRSVYKIARAFVDAAVDLREELPEMIEYGPLEIRIGDRPKQAQSRPS